MEILLNQLRSDLESSCHSSFRSPDFLLHRTLNLNCTGRSTTIIFCTWKNLLEESGIPFHFQFDKKMTVFLPMFYFIKMIVFVSMSHVLKIKIILI